MARYAFAFDMDTKTMTNDGLTKSQRTAIYQTEIKNALERAGFSEHPQGSLYLTKDEQNPITCILKLQTTLQNHAPNFGKYVQRVHVFRMEDWSDVTSILSNHQAAGEPSGEEELEEQEALEVI